MNQTLASEIACISLFVGMSLLSIVCYPLGYHRQREEDAPQEVSGAVVGAVFALLGLLMAFTFSGAYSRFDVRRQLIVQEANAIGTAYLRLDLLPVSPRIHFVRNSEPIRFPVPLCTTSSLMLRRQKASLPRRAHFRETFGRKQWP